MLKKSLLKAAATVALLATAVGAQATVISIDANFTFTWPSNPVYTGNIKASDLNSDGLITMNEVTAISETLGGHTLAALVDIGTINIAAMTWTPNGISWVGYPNTAYMTFDNRLWSCSTFNACSTSFTSFNTTGAAAVPEPAPLALIGLGLLGLGAVRRRTSA